MTDFLHIALAYPADVFVAVVAAATLTVHSRNRKADATNRCVITPA